MDNTNSFIEKKKEYNNSFWSLSSDEIQDINKRI